MPDWRQAVGLAPIAAAAGSESEWARAPKKACYPAMAVDGVRAPGAAEWARCRRRSRRPARKSRPARRAKKRAAPRRSTLSRPSAPRPPPASSSVSWHFTLRGDVPTMRVCPLRRLEARKGLRNWKYLRIVPVVGKVPAHRKLRRMEGRSARKWAASNPLSAARPQGPLHLPKRSGHANVGHIGAKANRCGGKSSASHIISFKKTFRAACPDSDRRDDTPRRQSRMSRLLAVATR